MEEIGKEWNRERRNGGEGEGMEDREKEWRR